MMEEERLKIEIAQMVQKHLSQKGRARVVGAILGVVVLVLVVLLLAGFGHVFKKDNGAGTYAAIAGTYRLVDIEVFDSFRVPHTYRDAGDCVIDAQGNIEFPYYYGQPDEGGGFGMIKGTLQPNDYPLHHYKITVDTPDVGEIYLSSLSLDVEENGVRIQEDVSSPDNRGGRLTRKLDLIFQ